MKNKGYSLKIEPNMLQLKCMESYLTNCPKCFGMEFWKTADKRLKCKKCRYIFTPRPNPFNVSNEILEKVISEFILEHSTKIISERVNISKYKLLKILTLLRRLMTSAEVQKEDIPNKQPIIGIICQEGKFFAEIVQNIESKNLKSLFKKISPIPDSLRRYTGLVFKGSLHRLSPKNEKEYPINALERFWGYLKRKLATKGGIRREKLPLYLGEYSWRYNHRKLTLKEQEKYLLNLVFQYFKSKSN
jgi:transposase-like protein